MYIFLYRKDKFTIVFLPDCPFPLSRRFTSWTGTWSIGMSNRIRKLNAKAVAPMPACARSSKPDELVIVESRRQSVTQKFKARDKIISFCAPGNIKTFPCCLSHLIGRQTKYPPYFMFRFTRVISFLSILKGNVFGWSLLKECLILYLTANAYARYFSNSRLNTVGYSLTFALTYLLSGLFISIF